MNTNIIILLIILFVFYIRYPKNDLKEHVSMGTLTQLMAKGPQDVHLSKDAEKWVNIQYPYGYYNFVWNNPTRLFTNYLYYPYIQSGLYPYINYINYPNYPNFL
jgi:hypothetical protein